MHRRIEIPVTPARNRDVHFAADAEVDLFLVAVPDARGFQYFIGLVEAMGFEKAITVVEQGLAALGS